MRTSSRGKIVEEDGWSVVVNYEDSFISQLITVRVVQRLSNGRFLVVGSGDGGEPTHRIVEEHETLDGAPSFRLPAQTASLIGRALLDHEPATDRLTNKLESLLSAEASRVDKLIDNMIGRQAGDD